jgi:flagellar M-ring protein FliF
LKELVKSAVGFNEERGDKIEVTSVAFQNEPMPAGEGTMGVVWRWVPPIATRLLGVAFAAFMLLNVVRPMILALGVPTAIEGAGAEGPLQIGGREGAMVAITKENQTLTKDNPERAAALIREWLLDGPGGPAVRG